MTSLNLPPHLGLAATRHGPMLFLRQDRFIGASLARYGEYSHGELALLLRLLRPGDRVLEVGANIGALTVAMAQAVGAAGHVLALEPQRIVFQILCANLALNGLLNTQALPLAAGAESGVLHVPPVDYGARGNFGGVALGAQGGEPVALRAIDSFDLPALRLLKVDVEGMEASVIAGAARTIARTRPFLYVENDRPDRSPALIRQIQALGYRLWWHLPPLYNPANPRGDAENMFGSTLSVNMLGAPAEMDLKTDLVPVTDPDMTWREAHQAAWLAGQPARRMAGDVGNSASST
ncbi:FkbM family methyltransferase [Zavarzinia sp. CC-PAN008]|uniref:FkbM family methyltransferase n=1 Tax=Zavarzinia sp. CC-PAN008 TaxID=3243332 RepID=UPI003F743ED9